MGRELRAHVFLGPTPGPDPATTKFLGPSPDPVGPGSETARDLKISIFLDPDPIINWTSDPDPVGSGSGPGLGPGPKNLFNRVRVRIRVQKEFI